MENRWRGWFVVGVLWATTLYVVAEEIRLTTYYPSPMGVYQELRVGSGELGTPHAKLQVNQPTNDGLLAVRVTDEPNNDPTPFVIDQDGRVGIGTENPTNLLQIVGPDASTARFVQQINAGSNDFFERIVNPGGSANSLIGSNLTAFMWSTGATGFAGENSSVKMTLTSGGNVGIGTTDPKAKLHVDDGPGEAPLRISVSNGLNPVELYTISTNAWTTCNAATTCQYNSPGGICLAAWLVSTKENKPCDYTGVAGEDKTCLCARAR